MTKTTKAGADAPKAPEAKEAAQEQPQEKHTPNAILELIRLGIEHGLIVDSTLEYDSEELTRELYATVARLNAGEDYITLQDFCRTLIGLDGNNMIDELEGLNLFRRGFATGHLADCMKYPWEYDISRDLWARFWKR